jgi:hypothetical protein
MGRYWNKARPEDRSRILALIEKLKRERPANWKAEAQALIHRLERLEGGYPRIREHDFNTDLGGHKARPVHVVPTFDDYDEESDP